MLKKMQYSVVTKPYDEVYFTEDCTLEYVNDALVHDELSLNISKTLKQYGIKTQKPFNEFKNTTLKDLAEGRLIFD